jgi:hypothetical protein
VSGMTRHGPGIVLSSGPVRFFGRISYSLYLWHWPIFVLPVVAMEGELPLTWRVALAAFAVLVAWASWRFVEEPFRAGFPSLARHPGRTVLAGAAAVAIVVSTAGGLAAAESPIGGTAFVDTSLEPSPEDLEGTPGESDIHGPFETVWPSTEPSAEPSAELSAEPAATAAPTTTASNPPAAGTRAPAATPAAALHVYIRLPSDVRPTLAGARSDEERLRRDGCLAFEGVTSPRDCVYGDPKGAFSVALVGDSHAAQWFPAVERVAKAHGWRLLTFVKVACPFLDMPVRNVALKREYRECAAFNDATIARLRQARPDLTLVSMSRYAIHPVLKRDMTIAAQGAAYARMLDRIPGRVAVIVDTPDAGRDIPACLSRHVADVRDCAIARATALSKDLGAIERAATETTRDDLIDLTDRICRDDPCPVVVDGMIVFRDLRHLTATFSRSLAPDLGRRLDVILASTGP